jgi:hypothetical protein
VNPEFTDAQRNRNLDETSIVIRHKTKGGHVITVKELDILKACLRYALEELGPHCPAAFQNYWAEGTVQESELSELARKLDSAQLLYVEVIRGSVSFIEPDQLEGRQPPRNLGTLLLVELPSE